MKTVHFHILILLHFFSSLSGNYLLAQEKGSVNLADKSLYYVNLSLKYYQNDYPDSLKSTFKEFFKKIEEEPNSFPADYWSAEAYQLAVKLFTGGELELLTDIFNPLLTLQPIVNDNKYYFELGRIISIMATSYKNIGYVAESIPIYQQALNNFKLCQTLPIETLPSFYINLGNALRNLGDLSEASDYYNRALQIIDNHLSDYTISLGSRSTFLDRKANTLNSLGLTLQGLGKHKEALDFFSRSMEIAITSQPVMVRKLNNNMGVSYNELQDTAKAEFHYENAIAAFDNPGSYNDSWVLYSLNYADLLIMLKKYDKAGKIVGEILLSGSEIKGVSSSQMATAYFQMGTIDSKEGRFESGVHNMDLGLSQITGINIQKNSNISIPEISLANSPFKVIQGIKFRARNFKDWGDSVKTPDKYLIALDNYDLAELCIDSLRAKLDGEESKINLSRLEKETYSEKIEILWKLYSESHSPEIIAKAFKTAEKGKASGIWNLIQLNENKRELLPLEIVKEEKNIKNEIARYDNEILAFNLSDPNYEDSIKTQRFLLAQKLDSLNNFIKLNFPEYNKEIFKNEVFSLEEIINSLSQDQVMIQYFFSENFLHQMLVSRDTLVYRAIPNPAEIMNQLDSFNRKLYFPVHDYSKKDVAAYQESAWKLFKILVDPFEPLLFGKEIIILPDENLSLLPFEALVTAEGLSSKSDFRDLKYFLRQNIITYSFNASMWAYQKEPPKHVSKAIFGFAPSYDVSGLDTSSFWKTRRSLIPSLPGTLEEIKLLKKKYKANTFSGKKATEKLFKEKAAKYEILHLAMHSLTIENKPGNYALVFTPFADRDEDGLLYANEIRNLNINSSLTILSACKTGTGELAAGEGVLSLSRMFLLAGSSSVLMTLWSVDDVASRSLMKDFYKSLAQNKSVSEALRSSKMDFLASASKLNSHPSFWSGFIHLGRDTNIQIRRKPKPWQVYSGGAILVGLIIFMFFKNTKSRP